MDKEQLIENVRGWIAIDNEIKQLQKVIKEKRKEKKIELLNIDDVQLGSANINPDYDANYEIVKKGSHRDHDVGHR